jgi:(2Fe-2S) ferredoxin
MKFKKHVFICTNDKEAPKKCCGSEKGMALVEAFKEALKEQNLLIEVRAQKSGCLDVCAFGPSIVVYPEGIWYGNVQTTDVREIVENHLVNDRPVERLQLKFAPKIWLVDTPEQPS